jgi:hypothetical protein
MSHLKNLAQSDTQDEPVHLERTEQLSEWTYEMAVWWKPVIYSNTLWLFYQELGNENEEILQYRTYDGVWSSPQTLSSPGDFIAAVEDDGVLTVFWNTAIKEESEIVKNICFKTFANQWSQPSCAEPEPFIGDQFIVELTDSIWLVQSRRGFWEYQIFQKDGWSSLQVLATTEGYDRILKVVSQGDDVWIFYESEASDIYCRVFHQQTLSESYLLAAEGFPYLVDVVQVDTEMLVFFELQETGAHGKTLAYTRFHGEWSPLEAVATPEEGFLSAGSAVGLSDNRVFVFWNSGEPGTVQPQKADISYRVYDQKWSHIYTLTDTPDVWETVPTAVEYTDQLIIIWRDKESRIVYASYAFLGEGGAGGESDPLQSVAPKAEPEGPPPPPVRVDTHVVLILVGIGVVLLLVIRVKRKKSDMSEQIRIGERRKSQQKKRQK